MTEAVLIPSIDKRVAALLELSRRRGLEKNRTKKPVPTITLSREYGCEAYQTAELLARMLMEKSGEEWVIVDRELLERLARDSSLSPGILDDQGEKNLFLDEMLATFSSYWRSDREAFSTLSEQIMTLAAGGNVIIVGRASSFITKVMKNCFHFRLYASTQFKCRSVASRLGLSQDQAEELVARKQKQRDRFINDFVDRDPQDMSGYHLLMNNELNSPAKMARTIVEYVFGC